MKSNKQREQEWPSERQLKRVLLNLRSRGDGLYHIDGKRVGEGITVEVRNGHLNVPRIEHEVSNTTWGTIHATAHNLNKEPALHVGTRLAKKAREDACDPPKGLLIDALVPPERAEDALYNILGRYDYWVKKYGMQRARLIFFTQSFVFVVCYWTEWFVRLWKPARQSKRS